MRQIRATQINEWIKDPVAYEVILALKEEIRQTREEKIGAYVPANPQATFEQFTRLNATEIAFQIMLDFFEGDFTMLFNEENDVEILEDV